MAEQLRPGYSHDSQPHHAVAHRACWPSPRALYFNGHADRGHRPGDRRRPDRLPATARSPGPPGRSRGWARSSTSSATFVTSPRVLTVAIHSKFFPPWIILIYLFREFWVVSIRRYVAGRATNIPSNLAGKAEDELPHVGLLADLPVDRRRVPAGRALAAPCRAADRWHRAFPQLRQRHRLHPRVRRRSTRPPPGSGTGRKKVDLTAMHRARRSSCGGQRAALAGRPRWSGRCWSWPRSRPWPSPPAAPRSATSPASPFPPAATCPAGNLLAGKRPVHWTDIRGGRIAGPPTAWSANEGAVWDAPLATVLETGASMLTWDLGQVVPLQAAVGAGRRQRLLHGVGLGRRQQLPAIWAGWNRSRGCTACAAGRCRWAGAPVRFLRIGEGQGDSFYSVSEMQAFCQLPGGVPAQAAGGAGGRRGGRQEPAGPTGTTRARARWELVLALLGLGLLAVGRAADARGPARRPQAAARSVAGGAGGDRRALTYINFGSFHFGNFIHDWEWTHYYVGSKYFKELSYDRLYECIAIADAEERPPAPAGRAAQADQPAHQRARVQQADCWRTPRRCKQHFSAARWEEFKHDVRFFRDRQSAKRWDDLQTDHGYNGTPVWNVAGHAAGQHRAGQQGAAVHAGHAGSAVPAGHHRR